MLDPSHQIFNGILLVVKNAEVTVTLSTVYLTLPYAGVSTVRYRGSVLIFTDTVLRYRPLKCHLDCESVCCPILCLSVNDLSLVPRSLLLILWRLQILPSSMSSFPPFDLAQKDATPIKCDEKYYSH